MRPPRGGGSGALSRSESCFGADVGSKDPAETPRVFAAPDRPVPPEAGLLLGGAPLVRRRVRLRHPRGCRLLRPQTLY